MMGDRIHEALATVGVTPEVVKGWLGRPCDCAERREKLNQLGLWAARVAAGRVDGAVNFLRRVMGSD